MDENKFEGNDYENKTALIANKNNNYDKATRAVCLAKQIDI